MTPSAWRSRSEPTAWPSARRVSPPAFRSCRAASSRCSPSPARVSSPPSGVVASGGVAVSADRHRRAARHAQRPLRHPDGAGAAGGGLASRGRRRRSRSTSRPASRSPKPRGRRRRCARASGSLALGVFIFWNIFTLLGALGAKALGNPASWGLDAAVPAAFLGLLWPRLQTNYHAGRRGRVDGLRDSRHAAVAGRSADHRHDGRRGGLRMAGAVSTHSRCGSCWVATSALCFAIKLLGHFVPERWLANDRLQRINSLIPICAAERPRRRPGRRRQDARRDRSSTRRSRGRAGGATWPRRRSPWSSWPRPRPQRSCITCTDSRASGYLPCQFGSRFSAKATAPSSASALRPICPKASVLSVQDSSSESSQRLLHDVLRDPHGERRVLRDAFGERDGLVEYLIARHDAVDQTEFVGALRVDGLGGERHLVGDGEGDALGQADESAAARDETARRFRDAELGVVGRDHHVATDRGSRSRPRAPTRSRRR